MKIEEIRIPAPWGHIAVKLWGNESNEAILAIHGVLDNAGSFHNLIAQLPDNFYYICVDLPGHGKSDPFPLSLPIHVTDYVVPLKIITDHFKKDKYVLMGHSLGGQVGMLFAQLYGNQVSKIVLLDALYVYPFDEAVFLDMTKSAIERLFKIIDQNKEKNTKHTYSYEEAIQKMINGRDHGKMTRLAVEPMVNRMFEKVGNDKYIMNIDSRLKDRLYPTGTLDFLARVIEERPIRCPVLILLSSDRDLANILEPMYEIYVQRKYEIHTYDGHHDMHNTNPEILAPYIIRFLAKYKNKL